MMNVSASILRYCDMYTPVGRSIYPLNSSSSNSSHQLIQVAAIKAKFVYVHPTPPSAAEIMSSTNTNDRVFSSVFTHPISSSAMSFFKKLFGTIVVIGSRPADLKKLWRPLGLRRNYYDRWARISQISTPTKRRQNPKYNQRVAGEEWWNPCSHCDDAYSSWCRA